MVRIGCAARIVLDDGGGALELRARDGALELRARDGAVVELSVASVVASPASLDVGAAGFDLTSRDVRDVRDVEDDVARDARPGWGVDAAGRIRTV